MFVEPLLVSLGELIAGGVEAGGGEVGAVAEPVVCPGAGGDIGAVVVVCEVEIGAIDGLFSP